MSTDLVKAQRVAREARKLCSAVTTPELATEAAAAVAAIKRVEDRAAHLLREAFHR